MAEYKRFIAYFYEYIDGKKERNAGFAKVELRNGMWRILFRLTARVQPPAYAYGFVREQGYLHGIMMGTLQEGQEVAEEWAYRADSPVGQGRYRMEELAGIWIQSSDGRRFVTVWDDDPIQVERFVLEIPEHEERKNMAEVSKEPDLPEEQSGQGDAITENTTVESMETEQKRMEAAVPLAEELMEKREKFQPFSDQEFACCVKLLPCDIVRMQQANWNVGRSTFLQHGYYQYHHLLLGKTREGSYVLGVPGMQSQQEAYMAGMFGYDRFRAVRRYECGRMFGYWCQEL